MLSRLNLLARPGLMVPSMEATIPYTKMARLAAKISSMALFSQCLIDDDRGFFRHVEDRVNNALAANAALLEAAERNIAWTEGAGAVDHNSADFQFMGDLQRVTDVFRKDA